MAEFDLIDLIRERCDLLREDVRLGIGDDAAVLAVPPGQWLAVSTDTLVSGVHFLPDADARDVGWKSLAVNLSDMAAMGAEPAWATLALTLPSADAGWLGGFADGFAELANLHRVALVGGDTTQGPLSITITIHGFVPHGGALTRAGARAGDGVYVTGTLGDAAAGLRLLQAAARGQETAPFRPCGPPSPAAREQQETAPFWPGPPSVAARAQENSAQGTSTAPEQAGFVLPPRAGEGAEGGRGELLARIQRPTPRVAQGLILRGRALACIDVSDGLVADLGHICNASGVGAMVDADALPASSALGEAFDAQTRREFQLAGGDDYELCFTASDAIAPILLRELRDSGCAATRIGRIVAGSGVSVHDASGNPVVIAHAGWEHFA